MGPLKRAKPAYEGPAARRRSRGRRHNFDALTRGASLDELWTILGGSGFLLSRPWPAVDTVAAREDDVEIAVQINGKVRGRIRIATTADEATALGAARAAVENQLAGKTPKKVVYVAGRIINLIV